MNIKIIVWGSGQKRISDFWVEGSTKIWFKDGDLCHDKECASEPAFSFDPLEGNAGYSLVSHSQGLTVNGQSAMTRSELLPLENAELSVEKNLKKIRQTFISKLTFDLAFSDEVITFSDVNDAVQELITHQRKRQLLESSIEQLQSDDFVDINGIFKALSNEAIVDEYVRKDSKLTFLDVLERLLIEFDKKDFLFLTSHPVRLSVNEIKTLVEQLSWLVALNTSKFEVFKQICSIDVPKNFSTVDELHSLISQTLQSQRNLTRIQSGDMINLGDHTLEVNMISPNASYPHWNNPFETSMTYHEVDRIIDAVIKHPVTQKEFQSFVKGKTPSETVEAVNELRNNLPELRNILRYDARVLEFDPAEGRTDVICNFGDFGNTAYYILEGEVRVLLNAEPLNLSKGSARGSSKFMSTLSKLWSAKHNYKEWRKKKSTLSSVSNNSRYVLHQDFPEVLQAKEQSITLPVGELIGENSAMGRTPRNATLLVEKKSRILEIRWQGLRELRNQCPALKKMTDDRFLNRGMDALLRGADLFRHLTDDADRKGLASKVKLNSYGSFDWNTSYLELVAKGKTKSLEGEPVIAKEGQFPDGIFLIRSGFARVSKVSNAGRKTLSYIGKGAVFGLEECLYNEEQENKVCYAHSLTAIGYVDTVFVPLAALKEYVLDRSDAAEEVEKARKDSVEYFGEGMDQSVIEEVVQRRTINGSSSMMIDMDRCTRCDDCVTACASAHDGNPRFLREGPIIDNLMIANACMHCHDPVCMIGCPTGAIQRNISAGEVVIEEPLCIGCSTCANSCPYGNIRMVDLSDDRGSQKLKSDGMVEMKATKCDLCADLAGGPNCERACPHDAMKRVDLNELSDFESWVIQHHAP